MCEGSVLNVASSRRPCRESDRVVRALRPGNADGAKGPDFRCASEDGEVEVIGDKPGNTVEDRNRPRLLCRRAKESHSLGKYRAQLESLPVCPSMKLVGKPGAGNRHARFDSVFVGRHGLRCNMWAR